MMFREQEFGNSLEEYGIMKLNLLAKNSMYNGKSSQLKDSLQYIYVYTHTFPINTELYRNTCQKDKKRKQVLGEYAMSGIHQ